MKNHRFYRGVVSSGLLLLSAVLLCGCSPGKTKESSATIFAMNTVMDLTVYGPEDAVNGAEDLIYNLEKEISVTDDRSQIYALNHDGSGNVTEDVAGLLENALYYCAETDGALDITIYPIIRAWGFTTGDYQIPSESDISSLLKKVDYTKISFDGEKVSVPQGAEIDLGAVAKGYTGDMVMNYWSSLGITSGIINLGGNVQALGSKPDGSDWYVGIRDPMDTSTYIGGIHIKDECVITSGGYERYFEQDGKTYWHIIDPSTGYPADSGLVSVTIIGKEGIMCDALSTSLFIMGLNKASDFWRSHNDFEAIFITSDGSLYITEGLSGNFTPLNNYKDTEVNIIEK